ncbi:YafY family protein [Ramlibacter sp.]|uniref:helix-turn-helix transcriptional regulator n=1 Tax=Ramlibacter sp. TaxID=1917967 RepID=UPI00184681BF|nr:YafY family protein [Ramlibacter sp.]MBA2673780.1 YafY family transcriptional regulator [Ramlibacter sp.]
MRRADRLFHIIQLIRGRRLTTAAYLAQRLEVSERTIYRDVADLQLQGVPIEGEAGVGYRLGVGFDLPPMMFTNDEAKALVASVRMAQAWLDPALAHSAEDALGKILAVLPTDARVAAEALAVYAPLGGLSESAQTMLQTLREAAQERRKVFINYRDLTDKLTQRTVRPLGCFYWGKVWTLAGWCEERNDFRSFRIDRVTYVRRMDDRFRDEPGRTLADLERLDHEWYKDAHWTSDAPAHESPARATA